MPTKAKSVKDKTLLAGGAIIKTVANAEHIAILNSIVAQAKP
jgi:hypothetical protein